MALSILGALSLSSSLNLTTVGNTFVVPIAPTKRLALSVVTGLTGSGATLAVDGSRDGGNTWVTTGMSAVDYDTGAAFTTLTDDADYRVITRGYTHLQVRVASAGAGSASVILVPQARAQDVFSANPSTGGGGGGGTGGIVSDPALEQAIGSTGDPPTANTMVGLTKALVNTFKTAIAVTINGALPAGANLIGAVTVAATGIGALTAAPVPSANGTALAAAVPGMRGVRLYLPPGGSVTYTIAPAQPTAAPAATVTIANPSTSTIPVNWDEDLAGSQMIYLTAATGSPLFRLY